MHLHDRLTALSRASTHSSFKSKLLHICDYLGDVYLAIEELTLHGFEIQYIKFRPPCDGDLSITQFQRFSEKALYLARGAHQSST